jgi:hypothetical protein
MRMLVELDAEREAADRSDRDAVRAIRECAADCTDTPEDFTRKAVVDLLADIAISLRLIGRRLPL